MTAFDRIHAQMPELLDELAASRAPDYVDDLLRQTARSRQRPAWATLERWLPMGALARTTSPLRQVPWRPVLVAAILVVALAAAIVLISGAPRTRVPPPFGPAANGELVYGASGGDIAAIDPVSGTTRTLLSGPTEDWDPGVSPDGLRFFFNRTNGAAEELWVANIDGSGAHRVLASGSSGDWIAWAPSSDRLVVVPTSTGEPVVVDADTGRATSVPLATPVKTAQWVAGGDRLLVAGDNGTTHTFAVVALDGSGFRRVPTVGDVASEAALSPDGTSIAYATWVDPPGRGDIHVVSLAGGPDALLTPDQGDGASWDDPHFSPDGTRVLVRRWLAGADPATFQLATLPVDGSGPPIVFGAWHEVGPSGATEAYSPDGTQAIAHYSDDGSTWLLPVDGRPGRPLALPNDQFSWQRLAP